MMLVAPRHWKTAFRIVAIGRSVSTLGKEREISWRVTDRQRLIKLYINVFDSVAQEAIVQQKCVV